MQRYRGRGVNEPQAVVVKHDDSHIYYNAILTNPITATSVIPANYNDNRSDAIIPNVSNYHLAVVRASFAADLVPIFVFQDGQYKLTLTYNGVSYPATVVFTQSDFADPNDRGIYNYQQFLDQINTAFALAYSNLNTAVMGAQPPQSAPIMYFDVATQLFKLKLDKRYSAAIAGAPTVGIYFNQPLWSRFETFNSLFYGYNQVSGLDWQFVIEDTGTNNDGTYLTMTQEIVAIGAMTDIQGITVVSNSMPIVAEQIPLSSGSSGSSIAGMLDLEINVSESPIGIAYWQYLPQFYRYMDMKGESDLRRIDFTVYYYDRSGKLYPLYISPGRDITMKLLFERKQ